MHEVWQCALFTYFMEHSPSWEAIRFSVNQQTPRTLWNLRVHHHLQNSPPPAPILDQINPVYTPQTTSPRSSLISSSHRRLGLPSGLFPPDFPTKTLHTTLLYSVRATCPAHLILLKFITQIIFGEEYRSVSSSLCGLLNYPIISSLLSPNTLLKTLFTDTLRIRSSLSVCHQVSHPYKTTGIIIVLYILIFKFLDSKLEDKRFCNYTEE